MNSSLISLYLFQAPIYKCIYMLTLLHAFVTRGRGAPLTPQFYPVSFLLGSKRILIMNTPFISPIFWTRTLMIRRGVGSTPWKREKNWRPLRKLLCMPLFVTRRTYTGEPGLHHQGGHGAAARYPGAGGRGV